MPRLQSYKPDPKIKKQREAREQIERGSLAEMADSIRSLPDAVRVIKLLVAALEDHTSKR